MSLDEARRKITQLDAEIVKLLDERARVGAQIGAYKRAAGLALRQPERERAVLDSLAALSDGGMPRQSLEIIYRAIMTQTTAVQAGGGCGCENAAARATGKQDVAAEVMENVEAAPGFFRMRLLCPAVGNAFLPGQFFQIRVSLGGEGAFLRRPFAPSECTADGFSFVYAVVGTGTRRLSRLVPGEQVGVLAPLGNGFTLGPAIQRALLIGGGCGAPSLATLARALRERSVHTTVVLGARTAAVLLEQEMFARTADRLIIATDDGSHGCRGTVVDACRHESEAKNADIVYACGPTPMLRAVAAMAKELGVPCEVSLEERMACGFGACMGCVVPVLTGDGGSAYKRVCHDGPVFPAAALAWNEMR